MAAGQDAIRLYGEARDLWRNRGDYKNAAIAARRQGATHEQLGAFDDAVRSYGQAAGLARRSLDKLQESSILSALGRARALAGESELEWASAEATCRTALSLARGGAGDVAEAQALNCIGEVAYARGKRADAIDFYVKAEAILQRSDAPEAMADTLLLLGYAHSDLRRFDEARAYYDAALKGWNSQGNKRGTALTSVAIARMKWRQGDYQESLTQFFEASELFERMGGIVDLASSYNGIAHVYNDMGQYQNARRYGNRALELFEAAGLENFLPDMLDFLGLIELALGDARAALSTFTRALKLSEQSGNRLFQAHALRYLGYAHLSLGDPDQALAALTEVLELSEITDEPRLHAGALSDIGAALTQKGEHEASVGFYERAIGFSRTASDRVGEARDLYGLARALNHLGELTSATENLEAALAVTEALRASIASRELRATFVASVHHYYRLYVDLLMQAHELKPMAGFAARAFEASERARARSLLESLAATGVDLREGVDAELIAEEERLLASLNDKYRRQAELEFESDGPAARLLSDEIRDVEALHEQARSRIYAASPRYASLAKQQPITLRGAQSRLLDGNTVLLEYALGEERSYLWVVSLEDILVHVLPGRSEIEVLANQLRRLLTRPEARRRTHDEQYWHVARQLSRILLAPAASQVSGKRLVVVADGALQYVPFGALPMPAGPADVPMVVDHELVSLPSASTLAALRDQSDHGLGSRSTVAVFADPVFNADDPRLREKVSRTHAVVEPEARSFVPRLPLTAREAERIASVVDNRNILRKTGIDASRDAATSTALSEYRIIHFATHAVFNENEPGLSGLILSRYDQTGRPADGLVRLIDIYRLRLPAELVVLSACDTALGEAIEGEGIIGMVRGFMYAGSKRVIASLWQVQDVATTELMDRFYRKMLRENQSPAAALRHAQLSMWREGRWRHPYYWAAFILQGEWR